MFEGKVAFITGGAGGIGFATVKKLLAEGAKVCLCDKTPELTEGALRRVKEINPDYPVIGKNPQICSEQEVRAAMEEVVEKWGRIDVLFCNAGIDMSYPITRIPEGEFENVLNVNLVSTYVECRCVVPIMKRQGGGAIVNTSSVTGVFGSALGVAYPASKAGIIGLTKSLSMELARFNIRVNSVAPGVIKTHMTETLSEDIRTGFEKSIPLKRMGEPDEVADALLFLASDKAGYITGVTLLVDGGYRPYNQ